VETLSIELFHFLRPWWLLFIPLWLLLSYGLWTSHQQKNGWSALCDPALLTYLVGDVQQQNSASKGWIIAIMLAGFIASVALAGPAWKQLPQPVFQAQSAMIIVLDLSRSMDAQDVKPSRLIRAKQKVHDILSIRKEGQTGLIVFAGSAFDVVPLTTDNQAILSLLPALDSSMMPTQGSMASEALQRALAMFQRGAIHAGSVVMLCDGVDGGALMAAQQLAKAGHSLSILAVGTVDGAPIPLGSGTANGGFLKDNHGNIILPRIDASHLSTIASTGDGLFQYIRLDDADVLRLPGLIPSPFSHIDSDQVRQDMSITSDQWHEEGPWLLLLLLPLCALAFRRGVLLLLFVVPLLSSTMLPGSSYAMAWDDLWQTPDQQAQTLLKQGKNKEAAALFDDPQWQAAAHYRATQFDAAAQALSHNNDTESLYNKGNALARAGDLQAALDAYDAALKQHAAHKDATFNRDLVEQALQEQQNEQSNKQDKQDKQDKQKSDDPSSNKQGDPSQDKSESSEAGEPQKDQQQNNEQKSNDSKSDESDSEKKSNTETSEQANKEEEQTAQAHQTDPKALEEQQAAEQWLRRIPDDPGGLLRRKFKHQYQQRQQGQSGSTQAW